MSLYKFKSKKSFLLTFKGWCIKALDFYIKSSIHVALSVYALLQVTCIIFKVPYTESLSYTIFYGSILAYNFIKYSTIWLQSPLPIFYRPYLIMSILSGSAMCFYLYKLDLKTIFCLSIGLVLSILYVVPFYKRQSLRQLSGLKIYIVAITWVISTTLAPIIYFDLFINSQIIVYTMATFIWILCLMIPFEFRDLQIDPSYLKTWPQRLGIMTTRKIGCFLTLLLFILASFFYNFETNKALITQGFIYGITLAFILFSNPKQPKYYSSFLVESVPVFWWLLLILF